MDVWTRVDGYFEESLLPSDERLAGVKAANAAGGLPDIDVSAMQGKLLHLLVRAMGAKRVLEIGTLGGFSTIWLALGLAERGGKVVTLEANPKHAAVARENLERAGVAALVEVREGPALESLPKLAAEGAVFDFIFVDADKANIRNYVEWALKLSRVGTTIVVDNVVRGGAVLDGAAQDASVQGVRSMLEFLKQEQRLSATAIQTVGSKGYDGFVLAVVVV